MPRRYLIPLPLLVGGALCVCGFLVLMNRFQIGGAPHPMTLTAQANAPVVLAVSSAPASNTSGVELTITGSGFAGRPVVTLTLCGLEPVALTDVRRTDTTTIRAIVPTGTPGGLYDLTVSNSDGASSEPFFSAVRIAHSAGQARSGRFDATPLNGSRFGFGTVAVAGNLYVVGGFSATGGWPGLHTVERAVIFDDGSLGQWQPAAELVSPRGMLGLAATGEHLYAIGGGLGLGSPSEKSVERAAVLPDGSLGPWEVVAQLPEVRYEAAVAAAGGYLFVMDGWAAWGGDLTPADTIRAAIAPDGSLGPWEPAVGTAGRSKQAAVADNAIYVLNDDGSIERTTVGPGGAIVPWQQVPATQVNHMGGAIAASDSHLFVLGGHNGLVDCSSAITDVDRAAINPDGSLGPWSTTPLLRIRRGWLGAAGWQNAVYAIGGEEPIGPEQVLRAGTSVEVVTNLRVSMGVFLPLAGVRAE